MPGNPPPVGAAQQTEYHLFYNHVSGALSDARFKWANPLEASVDAPAPGPDDQYVITSIHVEAETDTEMQIRNGDGSVYTIGVPGGSGSLPIREPAGIPVGRGHYPRLTSNNVTALRVHLFATLRPAPFAPQGTI